MIVNFLKLETGKIKEGFQQLNSNQLKVEK